MEQGRRREEFFTVTILLWSILDRNSPLHWEDNLISMDHLMQREKDLHSFVRTPQSVSPSFPILLLDVYIHILEKIRNTLEWSFTSNTLCIPAIIFSFLYNASWLSIGSFLCIFSFTNTIGETKQKKSPKRKWTKTVIQSLCRCYWQFQLRNYLYRQALIWNREQTVLFPKALCSQCSGYGNSTRQLKLTGWICDQLHPWGSSEFLSFVLHSLRLSGWGCKKH